MMPSLAFTRHLLPLPSILSLNYRSVKPEFLTSGRRPAAARFLPPSHRFGARSLPHPIRRFRIRRRRFRPASGHTSRRPARRCVARPPSCPPLGSPISRRGCGQRGRQCARFPPGFLRGRSPYVAAMRSYQFVTLRHKSRVQLRTVESCLDVPTRFMLLFTTCLAIRAVSEIV